MVGLLSLIVWLQNVCNSDNDEAYRILLLIPSTVVFKDEMLLEFLVTLVWTVFKDDSILNIESEIDEIFLVFVLTSNPKACNFFSQVLTFSPSHSGIVTGFSLEKAGTIKKTVIKAKANTPKTIARIINYLIIF